MTNHEYARLLLEQPEVPMFYEKICGPILGFPHMEPVTSVPEIQEITDPDEMLRVYELHEHNIMQFDDTQEGSDAFEEWTYQLSEKIVKEVRKIQAIVIN